MISDWNQFVQEFVERYLITHKDMSLKLIQNLQHEIIQERNSRDIIMIFPLLWRISVKTCFSAKNIDESF